MNSKKRLGIFCVLLSAVIFGFTPVLAGLSYQGGNNGVNMAFLRALLSLPVLMLLGRKTAPGFRATRRQLRTGFGAGLTMFSCTLMLYSSYSYLSVGVATTLHFLYPLFVVLYHIVFDHQRPGVLKMAGLIVGLLGAVILVEVGPGGLSPLGMALALLSGVLFAAYILILQKEAADPMPIYHLMTVISVAGALLCGVVGLGMGRLTLSMTPASWAYTVAVALLVSGAACTLFQTGVRLVGDADSAIYSLLEPLTSILFGMLLLGETFSLRKGVSCALIILGLFLTAWADKKRTA